MSAALATSGPPIHPGPLPDRSSGSAAERTRSGRLIGLIRKLVDFGKELVGTLHNTPSATKLREFTRRFGTSDTRLIVARITRGLRLAAALEDRVAKNAASLDNDPSPGVAASASPPARPRRPRQRAQTRARRDCSQSSLLNRLPTAREIAAQVRRRPIGVILADICNDLGILPLDPIWDELHEAVDGYGGDFLPVLKVMLRRSGLTVPAPGETPPPMPKRSQPGCSPLTQPPTGPP